MSGERLSQKLEELSSNELRQIKRRLEAQRAQNYQFYLDTGDQKCLIITQEIDQKIRQIESNPNYQF